jgi:hypothetical protein
MAPLFMLLGVVPLSLPLGTAAVFAWGWRASLTKPWLFFVAASALLYLILGTLVVLQFRNMGISGVPGTPEPFFSSFAGQVVLVLLAFLVCAALALWALRAVFGKV